MPNIEIRIESEARAKGEVHENERVKIVTSNKGKTLSDVNIWIGNELLTHIDKFGRNATETVIYDVSDYVGENRVYMTDRRGKEIGHLTRFLVKPRHIDIEDFQSIKDKRIPYLFEALGAENIIDMVYRGGSRTAETRLREYSVDRLLFYYSKNIIKITRKILLGALSYRSISERRTRKGEVKGKVNWPKTQIVQDSRGFDYALAHVCDRRKRSRDTATNLLLVKFHMELFKECYFLQAELEKREHEKVKWKRIYSYEETEYDKEIMQKIASLKVAMRMHRDFLMTQPFRSLIPYVRFVNKTDPFLTSKAEQEAAGQKNRGYREVLPLWKEYLHSYEPVYEKVVMVDLKRSSDIYELWCVSEIARAFSLISIGGTLREFRNQSNTVALHYQRLSSIREPWAEEMHGTEEMDRSITGPEIMLEMQHRTIYLDTYYPRTERAFVPKIEVYKALGYMNDFDITRGIIFYPGREATISYESRKGGAKQVLAQIPFLPFKEHGSYQYSKIEDYLRQAINGVFQISQHMEIGQEVDTRADKLKSDLESMF